MGLPATIPLLILLLTLIPGWLFLRFTNGFLSPYKRTSFGDLLSTVTSGLGLVTPGLSILAAQQPDPPGFLVDFIAWRSEGVSYAVNESTTFLTTILSIYVLALIIGIAIWLFLKCIKGKTYTEDDTWFDLFGSGDQRFWLQLRLESGEQFCGIPVRFPDVEDPNDARTIALASPVFYWGTADQDHEKIQLDSKYVVIQLSRVVYATATQTKPTADRTVAAESPSREESSDASGATAQHED